MGSCLAGPVTERRSEPVHGDVVVAHTLEHGRKRGIRERSPDLDRARKDQLVGLSGLAKQRDRGRL